MRPKEHIIKLLALGLYKTLGNTKAYVRPFTVQGYHHQKISIRTAC